jgi:hypothetical protein
MTAPREAHDRALMMLIKYIVLTENRGLVLSLKERWSSGYKFKRHGWLDSDYATNPDDYRSISDGRVFVNGAPIAFHSVTQNFVMLSMTKAKFAAGMISTGHVVHVPFVGFTRA